MEGLLDIHCHMIYDVDDGARNMEESVQMLKDAAENGISGIIATPHFRYEMFDYPKELIEERYLELKNVADELNVELFRGAEYHVNSDIIRDLKEGKVHTLADTKYVLCEFSHDSDIDEIKKYSRMLFANGYIPVIAHIERYCAFSKDSEEIGHLSEMGVLLQVNADSILGNDSRFLKKISRRLLKDGVADIVAGDSHGVDYRKNHLAECYKYVSRKFSKEYADALFITNPRKITDSVKKKQERVVENAE